MWVDAIRERRNPSRDCFRIRDETNSVILELPFIKILERGGDLRQNSARGRQLVDRPKTGSKLTKGK